MPNKIKTSGSTTKRSAIKNTNFLVGVDISDDYGPSSTTGFYNGITPPSGGYTIYVHKSSDGPSIHVANDDTQCIFFLKSFGATGSTISEVLSWSNSRTDMWIQSSDLTTSDLSSPYSLVTSGLQFNLQTAPSSGATWTDASGNGRNATLQGSPSYVSNNGGGIKLNNVNYAGTDYISVPYNFTGSTITVEIVASFSPTMFWATIWGNETYNSNAGYYAYMGSSTNMTWGRPPGTVSSTITASNSIRHWTWVINGTQYLLYLNGTQLGTTTTSSPAQSSFTTNNLYFGARHTNAGTGATDKINNSNSTYQPVFYQMRVYNKALSGSEVTQNFNAIKTTYGL